MDKKHLQELRDWIVRPEGGCKDNGDELFQELDTIVLLIDYWLEAHKCQETMASICSKVIINFTNEFQEQKCEECKSQGLNKL